MPVLLLLLLHACLCLASCSCSVEVSTEPGPGRLCGVVALFNAAGFSSRMANFRQFRARSRAQGLWLLAVELVFTTDAPFEVHLGTDADAVVRIRATKAHIMWQKERLLSVGLAALPVGACDKVAWPDAEVLFDNANWVPDTLVALDLFPVVQPFEHVLRLPEGVDWMDPDDAPVSKSKVESVRTSGIAAAVASRGRAALRSQRENGHTGFAWAGRREVLDQIGFFDASVVGGGVSELLEPTPLRPLFVARTNQLKPLKREGRPHGAWHARQLRSRARPAPSKSTLLLRRSLWGSSSIWWRGSGCGRRRR